jgi:hypothetical protein
MIPSIGAHLVPDREKWSQSGLMGHIGSQIATLAPKMTSGCLLVGAAMLNLI